MFSFDYHFFSLVFSILVFVRGQSISSIHGWLQSSKVEGEGEGSLSGAKSLLLAWFSYARVRAVKRAILMSIGDGKDAFKRIESTSGTAVFVPAQRREKGASFALPKSLSSPAANSRARGRCRALLFSIAEGSVFSEALRASGEQWRRARNAVSFSAYAFSGSTTASLASSAVSVYADSLRPQPVHLRPLITKWKSEVAATSKAVAVRLSCSKTFYFLSFAVVYVLSFDESDYDHGY